MYSDFDVFAELLRSDGSIMVNKNFILALGLNEAVLFCELLSRYNYFKKREMLTNGYFFNTQYDLQAATGLGEKAQRTAIKNLKMFKLLDVKLMGMPAKRYFKIIPDAERIRELLSEGEEKAKKLRDSTDTSIGGNLKRPKEGTSYAEGSGNNTNLIIKNNNTKRLTASDETVSLPLNIYSLLEKSNLSDNTYTAIARFIDMYYRYYGKQHPKIKQDNWNLVVERFDDLAEDKNLDPYCEYAELDLFDEKYSAYFEKYQQSKANIYHFTRALTSIDGDLKYTYQHVKEMSMR